MRTIYYSTTIAVLSVALAAAGISGADDPVVISDFWVATDALGRKLPTHEEVGGPRPNRQVAIFYWIWHQGGIADREPVNVNAVIKQHSEAINNYDHPVWKQVGQGYHWDEPLLGYYRSTDAWVLRRHAEMLADAGVDAIVFDTTNGTMTFKQSYDVLLRVFDQARRDGVRVPRIAFMLAFSPCDNSRVSITKLYQDIYAPRRYPELWFRWKGKPLIMAYPDNVPEPMRSFFTFRPGQPDYRRGPSRKDHWGWLEVHPQNGYVEVAPGRYEQVPVGVAQNATDSLAPAAMNDPAGAYGRSYTQGSGRDRRPGAILHGRNFQQQWNRALKVDPELVFVTGWNEWIAGRYRVWQGTENAFPDEFNDEYSRDIEPMRGGHGDNYYLQLIANVRRFKGLPEPPTVSEPVTIRIDGHFDDWRSVRPEYRDHKDRTAARNHRGYGRQIVYRSDTARNDIVRARVARDNENLYFYVETSGPLSPPRGRHWMMLLVDVDRDRQTGWEGYDFVVNRRSPSGQAVLELSDGGWQWKEAGRVPLRFEGNRLELAVPRPLVGLAGRPVDIELKWADNIQKEDRLMDFYLSGDVAPSGRFNYLFRESQGKRAGRSAN